MISCRAQLAPIPGEAPQSSSIPEMSGAVEPVNETQTAGTLLDAEKLEYELLRLINLEREAIGAEPLGVEEKMRFAARIRARETLADFSHTRPDGSPYGTVFDEAGTSCAGKWHGENIASLSFKSGMLDASKAAAEIFGELRHSHGHYRNMVNRKFLQTGVGICAEQNGATVKINMAQLFTSI